VNFALHSRNLGDEIMNRCENCMSAFNLEPAFGAGGSTDWRLPRRTMHAAVDGGVNWVYEDH